MSAFKDAALEARQEVDSAIEALERVPKNFGGHREADSTSTIDAVSRDEGWLAIHDDGRVMRVASFLDPADTPYATALCVYRGRWLVIPAHRLRRVGR